MSKIQSIIALLVVLFLAVGLGGCKPKEMPAEEYKMRIEQNDQLRRFVQRGGRTWEEMTPEEKQAWVASFDGDEKLAKEQFDKSMPGVLFFYGGESNSQLAPTK